MTEKMKVQNNDLMFFLFKIIERNKELDRLKQMELVKTANIMYPLIFERYGLLEYFRDFKYVHKLKRNFIVRVYNYKPGRHCTRRNMSICHRFEKQRWSFGWEINDVNLIDPNRPKKFKYPQYWKIVNEEYRSCGFSYYIRFRPHHKKFQEYNLDINDNEFYWWY